MSIYLLSLPDRLWNHNEPAKPRKNIESRIWSLICYSPVYICPYIYIYFFFFFFFLIYQISLSAFYNLTCISNRRTKQAQVSKCILVPHNTIRERQMDMLWVSIYLFQNFVIWIWPTMRSVYCLLAVKKHLICYKHRQPNEVIDSRVICRFFPLDSWGRGIVACGIVSKAQWACYSLKPLDNTEKW